MEFSSLNYVLNMIQQNQLLISELGKLAMGQPTNPLVAWLYWFAGQPDAMQKTVFGLQDLAWMMVRLWRWLLMEGS